TIHVLVPNPRRNQNSDFPRTLTESGLYSSVAEQSPAPGVLPYSINAEPWADHAVAERLIAVPGELAIKAEGPAWTFPKDSVLVKTLSLALRQNDPTSRRRVETQVLHFDGGEWRPYTYRWNDDQNDAALVDAAGAELTFDVVDADAPGGTRRQAWRFAGRAECQRCHNKWSGPALAFNTPQLNQDVACDGSPVSQLDTFARIGLFEKPIASEGRPRLADPRDDSADLNGRARAYLQTNCAHCHRMHAGSSVLSKMHYDLPLDKTDMIGVRPTQGTFGIHAAQVIAAGDPFRSVLLYRMAKLGGGRMPHIGSTEVDCAGVELICEWVRRMPREAPEKTTGNDVTARIHEAETAGLERLLAANAPTEVIEHVDRLLSSTSGALALMRSIDRQVLSGDAKAAAVETAAQHGEVSIRDLFERFLPPEKRVKRLGSAVRPEQILALAGDAARGRRVFFETAGVQCKNCHRIATEGKEVGPELTTIGKKLDRAKLLESLLEPSKLIDPKYVTYLAETSDGLQTTGVLVKKDASEVILKDAQNREIRIPAGLIEQFVPQQQSLMPELLLRDMTAEQVADLLEYLGTLK
ncbi:MAG TPA: hypothetical protein VND64_19955, partial [Pirellulales bacterium]|nr:hypothetical protein [Pirellulales bacterium]